MQIHENDLKTLERLAIMEQRILDMGNDLTEIKADVKNVIKSLAEGDFERRLSRIESASGFWKWASPILSSILTALITFLVISFLGKLS